MNDSELQRRLSDMLRQSLDHKYTCNIRLENLQDSIQELLEILFAGKQTTIAPIQP